MKEKEEAKGKRVTEQRDVYRYLSAEEGE